MEAKKIRLSAALVCCYWCIEAALICYYWCMEAGGGLDIMTTQGSNGLKGYLKGYPSQDSHMAAQ